MQAYPPDRYKRRFLVEFTPSESDLLDRLGLKQGTKRRAILDGLRLLESGELESLRERLAQAERERDAAMAEAAAATQQLAETVTLREELRTTTRQLREKRAAVRSARSQVGGSGVTPRRSGQAAGSCFTSSCSASPCSPSTSASDSSAR